MSQINISAPFIFKGKMPVSKAKFERFQKANPHMALMDASEQYGDYFSKLFKVPIKVFGTSSKNVLGNRWNQEHWWTRFGVLALTLEGPKGWKAPAVGTFLPDPKFGNFRLNKLGEVPAWVVSTNFPADVSTIEKQFGI